MNRRKGYQLLLVVLFFAFISLISRSIIYLILSIAIATILIGLLTGHKKNVESSDKHTLTASDQPRNNRLQSLFVILACVGAIVLGYGVVYFTENPFFQYLPMQDKTYIAVILIIVGFVITISSSYFLLKNYLSVGKGSNYCGYCGAQHKSKHSYCPNCGKAVK